MFDSNKDNKNKKNNKSTALDTALTYIDARRRTEKQLRDKLVKSGFQEDEIDETVERLKYDLLLGDESYTEDFINSRLSIKPLSKRQLEEQLIRNGIPRELAKSKISDIAPEDEMETAFRAAQSFFKSILNKCLEKLDDDADPDEAYELAVNKTIRRLMSRGYKYDHAKNAAQRAADEAREDYEY